MIARSEEGAPRDALFSPPRPATFEVQYPDGRASHSLTLRSYVTDTQAPVGSWVLVERAGATGGLRGASQCCVWPACPMRSVALPATRLLEHYRQAHGGDVPDDVLAWADGVRCGYCGMPYRRTGLAAHRRRDPADGALRCPALIRPEAASVLVTEADVRFADSLTADQVYIGVASSLDSIDAAVRDEYSAVVASLVAPCY